MLTATRPRTTPLDILGGEVIVIDKPLTWTSFDVVARLRNVAARRLGKKKLKVGHAGTLDPLATGVVIVTTGRATKLIDTLQAGEKEYVATLALGSTTPSFDLETEIDATYPTEHITRELIESVLPSFHGEIQQIPPTFSAIKVDGKRAYDYARKGREVELKPKTLVINEIEILSFDPTEKCLTLRIVCGKGTYIRALARDIGMALGSGAHLTALRRTRVGTATAADALSVDAAVEIIRTAELVADTPEQERTDQ